MRSPHAPLLSEGDDGFFCLPADRPNGKEGTSCANRTETHHVSPLHRKIDTRCVLFAIGASILASGERIIVSLRPTRSIHGQFSFFTPASSVYFGKLKAKKVAGPKTNAIAEPWSLSLPLAAPLLLLLPPRTKREN